jgi:hypothetical protein
MPAVSYSDIKDKLPKGISVEELVDIHEIPKAEQMFAEAEKITAGNFNSMSPQKFFKIRDGFQNCLRFIKELELDTRKTT